MENVNIINENTTNHALKLMSDYKPMQMSVESRVILDFKRLYFMLSQPVMGNGFSRKDSLDLMYVFFSMYIVNMSTDIFENFLFQKHFDENDFEIDDLNNSHNKEIVVSYKKFNLPEYNNSLESFESLYMNILRRYKYLNLLPLKGVQNYTPKNIKAKYGDVNPFELLVDHLHELDLDIETLTWVRNFPSDLKKSYNTNTEKNYETLKSYVKIILEGDNSEKERIKKIFFKRPDENSVGIISAYKNFGDFIESLKAQLVLTSSTSEVLNKIKELYLDKEATVVYNENDILVLDIHTNRASIALGTTAWCISREGWSHYRDSYMKGDSKPKLYFIYNFNLRKNDYLHMVGANYHGNDLYLVCDANNKDITSSFYEYIDKCGVPRGVFKAYTNKDSKKQGFNNILLDKYNKIDRDLDHNNIIYMLSLIADPDYKKIYKLYPDVSKKIVNYLISGLEKKNSYIVKQNHYDKLIYDVDFIINLHKTNKYFKISNYNDTILTFNQAHYRQIPLNYLVYLITNKNVYNGMTHASYKKLLDMFDDYEDLIDEVKFKQLNSFIKKEYNKQETNDVYFSKIVDMVDDGKSKELYKYCQRILNNERVDYESFNDTASLREYIMFSYVLINDFDGFKHLCEVNNKFKVKSYSSIEDFLGLLARDIDRKIKDKINIEIFIEYIVNSLEVIDCEIEEFLYMCYMINTSNLLSVATNKFLNARNFSEYELIKFEDNEYLLELCKCKDLPKLEYYINKYKDININNLEKAFTEYSRNGNDDILVYLISKKIKLEDDICAKIFIDNIGFFDKYMYGENNHYVCDAITNIFKLKISEQNDVENIINYLYDKNFNFKNNGDFKYLLDISPSKTNIDNIMGNVSGYNTSSIYKLLKMGIDIYSSINASQSYGNRKKVKNIILYLYDSKTMFKCFNDDVSLIKEKIVSCEKFLKENNIEDLSHYYFLLNYIDNYDMYLQFEDILKDDVKNKVFQAYTNQRYTFNNKSFKTIMYFLEKYKCNDIDILSNLLGYRQDLKIINDNVGMDNFMSCFNINVNKENISEILLTDNFDIIQYFLKDYKATDEINNSLNSDNSWDYHSHYIIGGKIDDTKIIKFLSDYPQLVK